ncbi:DNA mismatch repair protein Msh6p [[Candida] jaroonii]|uniref:DNA mismatch repair protein Msh6p n=1 Tax=[Candida] jaroonii TaxID=467808 RepID=A0ACA9Y344_9ASCO|nr:DNA mismatch repair protein Msh6p [[Candida] jaroonii]
MSQKVKKPMTPNSKNDNGKMKQSSLMSFFKPVKKIPPPTPIDSSPVHGLVSEKSNVNIKDNSHDESDKENDSSMMDTSLTDTPMTSEFDHQELAPQSSPISKKVERRKQHSSSPVPKEEKKETNSGRKVKSISYTEDDDEEDDIIPKKRRRIIESDDEDEDDFKPDAADDDDEDDMSDFIVDDEDEKSASEVEVEEEDDDVVIKPKSKKSKASPQPKSKAPVAKPSVKSDFASKFTANSSFTPTKAPSKPSVSPLITKKPSSFTKENEERYQWLVNIKDGEQRTIDDPEYDPRTLYVPQSAWAKFTPFEKQYWEIKSLMWDTVVFFKKGKFYELYENDAIIANTKFDLKIAGGGRANMKLAGIPEMSFDYWAREFINSGYKVAKVDQKESLLAKEIRGKNGQINSKEEKVIKRELTCVLTGGTLTDLNMISDDMAVYCLSIKEFQLNEDSKTFGVVFVDTSTSELQYIEFTDDNECSKLDTLITQVKPKEILVEKNNLCPIATKILKFNNSNQIWNNLNSEKEFWDNDTTLKYLNSCNYLEEIPEVLKTMERDNKVAFNAFGGLLFYLKTLKLDQSILTLQKFKHYEINKNQSKHLILDGITLHNLEILNNNYDGSDKGTLLKLINRAITPMGKRTLKSWVLHPLLNSDLINERFDSVDYLMNEGLEVRSIIETKLTGLPDLERLLSRIHSGNLKFKDFLKVIESFENIHGLVNELKNFIDGKTGSLFKFINKFPDFESEINEWENSFDREQALKDIISPTKGFDSEFDASMKLMNSYEEELNEHLSQYQQQFKSRDICYKDSGKEIYLIEVPAKIKSIPKDWQTMGATSKVKRYWSPEVKIIVRKLLEQRELHKDICENLKLKFFKKFDDNYSIWVRTIEILSKIDCLLALTRTSETVGFPSCRPKFVESSNGFIDFKELRNPIYSGQKEFIPNDIQLGGEQARFGLLTGANAAGKSTIMRTTALAVILSQIGCYVPATEATLTPIDRIMTRLGANDNILQGKSTFFVELSETKKILNNATPKSLVILDELGRGGSSSDGYAIAEAVLYQLSTHINPLGFFATHFNSLCLSFEKHPQIKPLRMGILVDSTSRNITFLYKLENGVASGSFGMNVASMCGISNEIIENAELAAKNYERTSNLKKLREFNKLSLGLQSDISWLINYDKNNEKFEDFMKFDKQLCLTNIFNMIE